MANIENIMQTYSKNMGNTTLPAIATRDLSLITGMNTNIDVARDESLMALEESVREDSLIVLISQVDPYAEEIKRSNLRPVGVLAKITNLIRLPYDAVKISVKIMNRVIVREVLQTQPFISIVAEIINYSSQEIGTMDRAMTNSLRDKFKEYSQAKMGGGDYEILSFLSSLKNPNEIIDIILPTLELGHAEFEEILCETNTVQRYKRVYRLLNEKVEIQSLENELEKDVKMRMSKMQREMYIREKIESLRNKLGDSDSKGMADDYTKKLNELPIADEYKQKVQKEIDRLAAVPAGSSEAGVIQTYVETVLDLPWKKEKKPEVDVKNAKKILDEDHYGLEKVKERILEYLAVLKRKDTLKGPIICLVGPPGVGKTSIAKAIAKASQRKFVRLSVGGTRDEAEIKGHRRTYIGAMPGRILAGLTQVGSNSPLFLFDEIDKLGADYKGDPSSALLEVLDPEQNANFSDHYVEIPFDLSNVLFVATANTTMTIPEPLLDRMEIIELPGYMPKEKFEIARRHLLPKEMESHGLKKGDLSITAPALKKIVSDYTLESGVRQLERCLAKICRKTVKMIEMDNVESVNVSIKNLHDFLGMELITFDKHKHRKNVGKVTGLAYTTYGGTTLIIEVAVTPGKGQIQLTGSLGDVMQESAKTAITFVRTIAKKAGIKQDFYEKNDIHIHVPEGATPKDGPSAGITLCTAVISALTGKAVPEDVAMTGEITLSGDVLPIGGLREKLLAASRSRVKTVLIPKENLKDLEEVPEDIKKPLKIIPVRRMEEVYEIMFEEKLK